MENFENYSSRLSEQEAIEEKKIEITPEQKEILESATKFADYLTNRYPQVDNAEGIEPQINYYLSGSLATMLLSQAETCIEVDEKLTESSIREIPESTQDVLASFSRQIGDLDYVPTVHYRDNPMRLKKGGGGPSFDEVPEEGLKALKRGENQFKIMCDPVDSYGVKRIAKIKVEDKDYYIARPDTMLAYKILHILQSYEQKPEKFNSDFGKLFGALGDMYTEEELEAITREILVNYENEMQNIYNQFNNTDTSPAYQKQIPQYMQKVLSHEQISPEIRNILEKLRNSI